MKVMVVAGEAQIAMSIGSQSLINLEGSVKDCGGKKFLYGQAAAEGNPDLLVAVESIVMMHALTPAVEAAMEAKMKEAQEAQMRRQASGLVVPNGMANPQSVLPFRQ